jgi:hypothetical protein
MLFLIGSFRPTRISVTQRGMLLTRKYVNGMDRNRHRADSYNKYRAYFDISLPKIKKYDLTPDRIYNIDEKGFLISIL